jgi:hypothetical protein
LPLVYALFRVALIHVLQRIFSGTPLCLMNVGN